MDLCNYTRHVILELADHFRIVLRNPVNPVVGELDILPRMSLVVDILQKLQSTTDVGIYALDAADGHSVSLIDTPGFDDTYCSDTEVLADVAYFLS
ncbi:hypothetical protein CEP54_003727 [Fusarium duplospermum]|uniref:Uncharacterized protein n=1 Tax=Fusarium duplospermum TaxID=1325734 RepID=A0A428QML0_9HYPO|nr:hypothetical protein CEP54_003727 [Fusarium duplospermum]